MPLSPSEINAFQKIAKLAGSDEPAGSKLEQILGIARKALNLDALCAVSNGSPDKVRVWHSLAEQFPLDSSQIMAQALDLCKDGADAKCGGDQFMVPVILGDKSSAAIIGWGAKNGEMESSFLHLLSGYISALIENERLAAALEASNQASNKHLHEVAAIYEIGQAMDATSIGPLLDMIVKKAASVMDAQACSLMLRNHRDGALTIEASYGLADDIVKGARINVGEGIAGKVAATGKPVLITDVSADPRFKDGVKPRMEVSGSMCVPLRDEDGSVRGVISIRRHVPNAPFDEEDLKLFSVFATHAALALSNGQLCTQLSQKVQEMSTISDVLRSINSTLDIEHVLNQIAESITDVVEFDRCCVYLLDSRTNEFVASARRGYSTGDKIKDRIKFDEGVIGIAARERIPIFSQGSPIEYATLGGTGEFLVAPIVVRDACIGVVVVDNSVLGRPIESQHVELLATFVSQAGIAVENARLYEAMEEKYAELNVLYEQSKSISAASGLDSAANTLVNTASRAVRCDGAAVMLLDNRRNKLKLLATHGGLVRLSPEIEKMAQQEHCVEFARECPNPVLMSADDEERTKGLNAGLLNALAPTKSNLMLVPLVTEETTIGLLSLYRGKPEDFQAADLKLIAIVASHAATVLKSALTYEQKMRQRVLELTTLYDFSQRISAAANLEEALGSILAIVADLVDYDESFIYAIDHEHQIASVKAARFRGKPEPTPADEPLDGGSVTSWAIKERKALLSPDISRDSRFNESGTGRKMVRSLMSIPLIVQDDVVGVLNVASYSPNQYSEDDVRVLSIIASQGAAIYKELEALTALTSYTDNILSSIAAGVVALNSDGTVLTCNTAAERLLGLPAERVMGLGYTHVLSYLGLAMEDKQILKRTIQSVFDTGAMYQGYKQCFHPRGQDEVYVNMSISQLLNSASEQLGLVIIFEDVTREIKMENEFRRMGELAAVGQLAASIAHELRNPLSSIKGAAQFLQKEYEDQSAIVEFLGIIIEEVNGLNKLTTEFLDFARPMQLELKSVSLNTVVDKTLQLMSVHITDNNVVVKESLSKSLPEIHADGKQLEQVLKNIIINALQAMPEGGLLALETGPTPSGGAYMAVTDNGIGIPPDKLERIFLPFFTTKTKGTGLGLSVVRKIVENHGGRIDVTSEAGKGTTFRVTLPHTGLHPIATAEVDQSSERRMSGRF